LGINGSGKSTLLQMLSGFLTPSEGKIIFSRNDEVIEEADRFQHVSITAPYVELIEELTLEEFLTYHFAFKKPLLPIADIITYIGLEASAYKILSKFSSGMKQRVKLAQAICADTSVLLLDEPCTNLDTDGIALYKKMVQEFCTSRIVVVASNDSQEYSICETHIDIMNYKNQEA
jgi:ABC-type multidrug transport system ATPase subunit